MKLDHIALIVSTEENINFYKKLGFAEEKRFERAYDTVIFMKCEEVVLEIFVDARHPERMNSPEAMGFRHVAFCVKSFEELDIKIDDIKTDWFGRRMSFVKDLDGQPIELIEDKRG